MLSQVFEFIELFYLIGCWKHWITYQNSIKEKMPQTIDIVIRSSIFSIFLLQNTDRMKVRVAKLLSGVCTSCWKFQIHSVLKCQYLAQVHLFINVALHAMREEGRSKVFHKWFHLECLLLHINAPDFTTSIKFKINLF